MTGKDRQSFEPIIKELFSYVKKHQFFWLLEKHQMKNLKQNKQKHTHLFHGM